MNVLDLNPSKFSPLHRPGCEGMSFAPVDVGTSMSLAVLKFEPHAHSDQHSTAHSQMFAVISGRGWVSVGNESKPVTSAQMVLIAAGEVHRFWTETEPMRAATFEWGLKHGRALQVARDPDELSRMAAEWFVLRSQRTLKTQDHFTVALSGGSTPRGMYDKLASDEFRDRVDWSRVYIFWGDERAVPPDDPQSNYRMAHEAFLSKIPITPEQVFRIAGERPPDQAADAYEIILRSLFEGDRFPRFDLVLLGLGDNGHTASLFPGTNMLRETTRWVASEYIPEINAARISLTAPALNGAADILFLVAGQGKADVLRRVWDGAQSTDSLPARLIAPKEGDVLWLVDEAAARRFPHIQDSA